MGATLIGVLAILLGGGSCGGRLSARELLGSLLAAAIVCSGIFIYWHLALAAILTAGAALGLDIALVLPLALFGPIAGPMIAAEIILSIRARCSRRRAASARKIEKCS